MAALIVRGNLGLGDMLICNAIFRYLAPSYSRVQIPCKAHNVESVAWMLADVSNIEIVPVKDDEGANEFVRSRSADMEYLGMGVCGKDGFDGGNFDKEFYRHAGLDFDLRWSGFKFPQPPCPIMATSWPYAFVHDDPENGGTIDQAWLPAQIQAFKPIKGVTNNIFNYVNVITGAEEIHCIDSSFALLADSLITTASKKVIHWYARKRINPVYRNGWEIWE